MAGKGKFRAILSITGTWSEERESLTTISLGKLVLLINARSIVVASPALPYLGEGEG